MFLYETDLLRSDLKHQFFSLLKQKLSSIKYFFNINSFKKIQIEVSTTETSNNK